MRVLLSSTNPAATLAARLPSAETAAMLSLNLARLITLTQCATSFDASAYDQDQV